MVSAKQKSAAEQIHTKMNQRGDYRQAFELERQIISQG